MSRKPWNDQNAGGRRCFAHRQAVFGWLTAWLGIMLPGLGHAANMPSQNVVLASIARVGPRETIVLLHDRAQWDAVLDRIGTGDAGWVDLATRLRPGADAGYAEGLTIGLAYALPRNPGAVLRVLGPDTDRVLAPGRVCGVPFIEPPMKDSLIYVHRAQDAVTALSAPGLVAVRHKCLEALANSAKEMETQ